MIDFKKIKHICEENSKISSKVVDEFLIYYAAERNNLEQEMNKRFAAYKHIIRKFPNELTNRLKAQYIAHKVFRQDGLIKSYLNHSALKNLPDKDRNYLVSQAEHSWRFSFSIIKNNPAENFYMMEDVFSNEEYLLYSPGITKTRESQSALLWSNLIGYNSSCYQSFGPIGAYKSFEPDDIFFFATEIDSNLSDENDLISNVEQDPIPYMMLLSGANYPLISNKNDQVVHVQAEYDMESMNTKDLTDSFITEYSKGVYRLSLKKWNEHPHFSQAYFDENNKTLLLTSMTDKGFSALVEGLNKYGYDFSDDHFVRVNLTMVTTASEILKKKIDLVKYEKLFSKNSSPAVKEGIEKLNKFLKLVIPEVNAGLKPDIDTLAAKAGIDIETAKELIAQIDKKIKGNDPYSKKKKK